MSIWGWWGITGEERPATRNCCVLLPLTPLSRGRVAQRLCPQEVRTRELFSSRQMPRRVVSFFFFFFIIPRSSPASRTMPRLQFSPLSAVCRGTRAQAGAQVASSTEETQCKSKYCNNREGRPLACLISDYGGAFKPRHKSPSSYIAQRSHTFMTVCELTGPTQPVQLDGSVSHERQWHQKRTD